MNILLGGGGEGGHTSSNSVAEMRCTAVLLMYDTALAVCFATMDNTAVY